MNLNASETMKYETDGDLIRLTLNRPEVLNAVNYQGTLDLHQAARAIHDDPHARAVLIRGTGRAFCTGIDLKELSAEETPHDYFYQWDQALRLLERADKLIICAIQGFALGGGLQLPLACDIRIATTDAVLGLPAAKEGFIPGLGTYRLPRYIGLGRAKRMAISGENIDGIEALRIGPAFRAVRCLLSLPRGREKGRAGRATILRAGTGQGVGWLRTYRYAAMQHLHGTCVTRISDLL